MTDAPVAPALKPANPRFSSGPCAKRPGWTVEALKGAPVGRSHRAKIGKTKLAEAIVLNIGQSNRAWLSQSRRQGRE